mgnify:CR=1 FL=1
MTDIYELSDRAVDRLAALDPVMATYLGVPGHDHRQHIGSTSAAHRPYGRWTGCWRSRSPPD